MRHPGATVGPSFPSSYGMRWVAVLALCLALVPARAVADNDWGVRRDPFDASVVRRYKALLARDPHDAAALRQLVAMYKRYRKVATLEAEYRAQIEAKEDWAALVVLPLGHHNVYISDTLVGELAATKFHINVIT